MPFKGCNISDPYWTIEGWILKFRLWSLIFYVFVYPCNPIFADGILLQCHVFVINPELSKLKDGAEVGRVQFVKQSASMIAVDTQRHVVWFRDCSFRSTYLYCCPPFLIVGDCIFGNEAMRPKRDLQSVIISSLCSPSSDLSGPCQAKSGLLLNPHIHLIQVSLSNELDMEYA